MADIDLSRVYTSLSARGVSPQVHIQSHRRIGETKAYKVVAAVHDVNSESDFSAAIATMTDGKGRVIPGSFNRDGRICVATVVANAQSRPMDASFQQLTASTALAADGAIWSVVSDRGAKRVVLESGDDLAAILAARQAARTVHANPVEGAHLVTASVGNGDLVRYVDVAAGNVKWGLAFRTEAGLAVVDAHLNPRNVLPDTVVARVPRAALPGDAARTPVQATAKISPDGLNKVLGYLKKAWPPGAATDAMLDRYRQLAKNAK